MQPTAGDFEAWANAGKTHRELHLQEVDQLVTWKRLLVLIAPHQAITCR